MTLKNVQALDGTHTLIAMFEFTALKLMQAKKDSVSLFRVANIPFLCVLAIQALFLSVAP